MDVTYYDEIIEKIHTELEYQNRKWGSNRVLNKLLWGAILGEELGEVYRAVLERKEDEYIDELVDLAASCISAINSVLIRKNRTDSVLQGQLQRVNDIKPLLDEDKFSQATREILLDMLDTFDSPEADKIRPAAEMLISYLENLEEKLADTDYDSREY